MGSLYASLISLGLLGSFSLISEGLAAGVQPRWHAGILVLVLATVAIVSLLTRQKWRGATATAVTLAVVLALALGGFEGAYDQIFKFVLYAHGLPAELIATLIPPALGKPGPVASLVAGMLLLPAGIWVLVSLKVLGRKETLE